MAEKLNALQTTEQAKERGFELLEEAMEKFTKETGFFITDVKIILHGGPSKGIDKVGLVDITIAGNKITVEPLKKVWRSQ